MEIFRRLATPLNSSNWILNQQENNNQDQRLAFGVEWLEIEEPVGVFFPRMKKRRRLIQLDQVNYVLHYDNYKHVIRVQDISLISPVEEMNEHGQVKWWMTIQDATTLQMWVLHFPSHDRLAVWVETLQAVIKATKSTASISDIVLVSAGSIHGVHDVHVSPTSNEKELVLDMNPAIGE